jgi:hypothetical protein
LSSKVSAQITFERWFGSSGWEIGRSVIPTSEGGYIVAGGKNSVGDWNFYVIKTNSNGDTLWTKTYGGIDFDSGWTIKKTFDGGYIIIGSTKSFGVGSFDVYLIKINANGDTLWTKTYGGTGMDFGYSVIQTPDTGYVMVGRTNSYGTGSEDVYLIKTNVNGDTIWTRTYGGLYYDCGISVTQAFDSTYVITGITYVNSINSNVYLLRVDTNGDTIWTKTYGDSAWDFGNSVTQTSDSGFIITGATNSHGAGSEDVYLIKTNANGDTVWTRTYGGTGYDCGSSVVQAFDDAYIIVGGITPSSGDSGDVYLIKTDINGDVIWTRTFGGPLFDWGYSVVQIPDGGYIVAGETFSYGSGLNDVYLIKTDSLGNVAGVSEQTDKERKTRGIRLTASPNPFISATTITLHRESENPSTYATTSKNGGGFGGFRNGETVIQIYDVSGRRVREISLLPFSFYLGVTWDGRDEANQVAPPGIYILKMGRRCVGKVVKMR